MLNIAEVPSVLVRALLDALESDDDVDPRTLVGDYEHVGAALLPELAASLELAHELPPEDGADLRFAVAEIATASAEPAVLALVLHDQIRRAEDETLDDVTVAFEGDPEAWTAAAHAVRLEAIAGGDDDLRRVCSSVLAMADPGTPGVLDALFEELPDDPFGVIHDLCGHGDPSAADALLEWQRKQQHPDELDDETAQAVYLSVRTALDWEAEVEDADLDRANAAAESVRLALRSEIEELQDELAAAKQALRDVRDLPLDGVSFVHGSGFGHGAGAGVSRNAPCPCGSGRKTKKCCG
jgi:hypothetical protein